MINTLGWDITWKTGPREKAPLSQDVGFVSEVGWDEGRFLGKEPLGRTGSWREETTRARLS